MGENSVILDLFDLKQKSLKFILSSYLIYIAKCQHIDTKRNVSIHDHNITTNNFIRKMKIDTKYPNEVFSIQFPPFNL